MELDQNNFNQLFNLHYNSLIRFVFSFINDYETTRDIVHDIFLKVWNNRYQLNSEKSIKSYIFTSARNSALNYLKHQQVIASNEKELIRTYQESEESFEEIEYNLEQLRKKLMQLSDKQRLVIQKCCIEGKIYKEVAKELGISENTVKTHFMRAMHFLREELKNNILLYLFLIKHSYTNKY